MKTLLTVGILMTIAGLADSRPQYSYPVPTNPLTTRPTPSEQEEQINPGGYYPPRGPERVQCKRVEVVPGTFEFNCVGADPNKITLSTEHILWLRNPGSQPQNLDIVVPNYQIQELIRAALKASNGGATNVNILLKKPETVYDVQAQDGGAYPNASPSVNIQYEAVKEPLSVHYPVDQPYNRLSAPIREP